MGTNPLSPTTLANQITVGLNKDLVKRGKDLLVYDQFVSKTRVPKNTGHTSYRFFISRDASASRVSTLTDGTPINTFQLIDETYVDVTAAQFGIAMKISDFTAANTIWDYAMRARDEFAADLALKWDDVVKGAVVTGLLNSDGTGVELFAGIANGGTGDSSANYTSLYALAPSASKISEATVLLAKTNLIINRARQINGDFVAVLPAQVEMDLLQDAGLRAAANMQQKSPQVYNGEVGRIYGIRFITTNNGSIEGTTYGTQSTAGKNVFGVHFMGADAVGAVSWSVDGKGSNWMASPQFIVKDKPDSADMLNQIYGVGAKACNAATILRSKSNVLLRCKATGYSTT
jgi:N4-gp56 family major capsid protein